MLNDSMASSSNSAPRSSIPLIGAFEGLRGLSAVMVVLYHLKLVHLDVVSGAYLFVDVFFVLSGYIMMLNYGDRVVDGRSALDFLGKRIARLYPLFLLTTVTVLVASKLVEPRMHVLLDHLGLLGVPQAVDGEVAGPGGNYAMRLLAWVTLTSSLGEFDRLYLNVPAWSISTEFWTYAIFASVLLRFRHRLSAIAGVLVVCALSVAVYVSVTRHGCLAQGKCLDVTYDAGFMRCIGSFFLGVLAFRLHALIGRRRAGAVLRSFDVALLGLLVVVVALSVTVPPLAFAVPFVAMALVAVLPLNGPASRMLGSGPLLWLGKMSFAIYLGHLTILTAFMPLFQSSVVPLFLKLGVLAVSLAVFAVLANRFVEEPGRRFAVRWLRRFTGMQPLDTVAVETKQAA